MTAMDITSPGEARCASCGRDSDQVPLVPLRYRGAEAWICTQHLPVLIHDPSRLVGKLAGAEHLAPADHHD